VVSADQSEADEVSVVSQLSDIGCLDDSTIQQPQHYTQCSATSNPLFVPQHTASHPVAFHSSMATPIVQQNSTMQPWAGRKGVPWLTFADAIKREQLQCTAQYRSKGKETSAAFLMEQVELRVAPLTPAQTTVESIRVGFADYIAAAELGYYPPVLLPKAVREVVDKEHSNKQEVSNLVSKRLQEQYAPLAKLAQAKGYLLVTEAMVETAVLSQRGPQAAVLTQAEASLTEVGLKVEPLTETDPIRTLVMQLAQWQLRKQQPDQLQSAAS